MFTEASLLKELYFPHFEGVTEINDSNHTQGIIPEKVNIRSVKSPNDNT